MFLWFWMPSSQPDKLIILQAGSLWAGAEHPSSPFRLCVLKQVPRWQFDEKSRTLGSHDVLLPCTTHPVKLCQPKASSFGWDGCLVPLVQFCSSSGCQMLILLPSLFGMSFWYMEKISFFTAIPFRPFPKFPLPFHIYVFSHPDSSPIGPWKGNVGFASLLPQSCENAFFHLTVNCTRVLIVTPCLPIKCCELCTGWFYSTL